MSNSYNKNLILSDPSRTVAGTTVNYESLNRIANSLNYNFATGGAHNALSQAYADNTFIQNQNTYKEMSEWRIPLLSLEHNELEVLVFYDIYATSSLCKARFSLSVGSSSATQVLNLDSNASIKNAKFNISFPSLSTYYATLKLEIKADTSVPAEVIIKSILARWVPLSSPLSAGRKSQYDAIGNNYFTPFGVNRATANNALTSRFAHNAIQSIASLRTRLKCLLCWSGVYNASSAAFTDPIYGNAPETYLSVGHIKTMIAYVLAPTGYDQLMYKKLELHIKFIGKSAPVEIDFFGNRITLLNTAGAVGWSIYEIELNYDQPSLRGNRDLPIFEAFFDNSEQALNLPRPDDFPDQNLVPYPLMDSSKYGRIISFSLFGL